MSRIDLRRTPLEGKRVKISRVKGGTYLGLGGEIVEDRMNVLVLNDHGHKKIIPKKVCTFMIYEEEEYLGEVEGEDLIGHPEARCN